MKEYTVLKSFRHNRSQVKPGDTVTMTEAQAQYLILSEHIKAKEETLAHESDDADKTAVTLSSKRKR